MADSSLIRLYEDTRRQASESGPWRLRWAVRRARWELSADPSNQRRQIKVVALENVAMKRGLLGAPSVPPLAQPPRRRVPSSLASRFLRPD